MKHAAKNNGTLILQSNYVRFLLIAIVFCYPIEGVGNEMTDPQLILTKMGEKYRKMATYSDEGVVITNHETTGEIEQQPFKIAFKRPQLFRFEWIDYSIADTGLRSFLWWCGKEAFTYTEPDHYETVSDLPLAIAAAVALSGGAVQTVPRLLLTAVNGFALTDLKNLRSLPPETFEREDCYRIQGTHPHGGRYDLWISKKDHVLRKVTRRLSYMGFSSIQEEIHRNVRINTRLSESIFDIGRPTRTASQNSAIGCRSALNKTEDLRQVANGRRISVCLPIVDCRFMHTQLHRNILLP